MTDVTSILGGAWRPPEKRVDPPETQLANAITDASIRHDLLPSDIQLDGNIHRFKTGTGKANQNGWYVGYGDGIPAGRFGDWRESISQTWVADVARELTAADHMALTRRMAEAKAARDEALDRKHEVAANTVETIWIHAQAASEDHPYLKRKGIAPHGARVTGDGRLVVPLYDGGELASLQYIAGDGKKLYHSGGKTGGCWWMVGDMDDPGLLYVAEGFATACTVHEATGRPCAVAYSAHNLTAVTGALKALYGEDQRIVIVADNDKSGVGESHASQACAAHGARYVMPPDLGDVNDYRAAGGDVAALLVPRGTDLLIQMDEFARQPAPIEWLVKGWLARESLIMIHGKSGGGKTFAVLDWALRIAAGMDEWNEKKVRGGPVIYLAGEGHHGMKARVAGWKHHFRQNKLNAWISRYGYDLDTPQGFVKTVDTIEAMQCKPVLIVVDTVHRFLSGNENDAQDVRAMLNSCSGLIQHFHCAVALVHHTGVSEDAQGRARGSSAWRGALDIEISVKAGNPENEQPGQLIQRKQKDGELLPPVYFRLEQVDVPGWKDEDGEQVTTAIMDIVGEPAKVNVALLDGKKKFKDAWFDTGAELDREGLPFVTDAALENWVDQGKVQHGKNKGKEPSKSALKKRHARIMEGLENLAATGDAERVTEPWKGFRALGQFADDLKARKGMMGK